MSARPIPSIVDPAARGIEGAMQHRHRRRFAGAGAADEGDRLPGADVERYLVQRRPLAIGERDALEPHLAFEPSDGARAGSVGDGGRDRHRVEIEPQIGGGAEDAEQEAVDLIEPRRPARSPAP